MESKIEAIKKWNPPTNINELRSFLGTVGYYQKFIFNYSKITAPLCKLLRKNIKYVWNDEQQVCFEKLKECLINAPILNFLILVNPLLSEQMPPMMDSEEYYFKRMKSLVKNILLIL